MSHVLSRDVPGHIFMSLSSNCSAGLRWAQDAALGPFMKHGLLCADVPLRNYSLIIDFQECIGYLNPLAYRCLILILENYGNLVHQ